MFDFVRWVRRLSSRSNANVCQKLPTRLGVEELEHRVVPTVVFNSALGGDTISWVPNNSAGQPANQVVTSPITNNPSVLNDPTVYFIFWGQSWTTAQAKVLANDAKALLQSTYLSSLTDYGSDGRASYGGFLVDNSQSYSGPYSAPPAPPGSSQEIQKVLSTNAAAAAWAKPKDGSATDSPIYVTVDDAGGSSIGNGPDVYTPPGSGTTLVSNHIWIDLSGFAGNQDNFTDLLSHELAERISSGTGNGIEMNAQVNAGTDGEWQNAQIADNEPDTENYTYRLSGSLLVQAYWSIQYNGFVVQDHNAQTVYLNPNWNLTTSPPQFQGNASLTIGGDQLGNLNDTITLNQTASGGVKVTLNGEVFQFDPGKISSIIVNPGLGNNIINVENLPAGMSLNIDSTGGTDTVNFSPAAHDLDNLNSNKINIAGDGQTSVNLYDQSGPSGTAYEVAPEAIYQNNFNNILDFNVAAITLHVGRAATVKIDPLEQLQQIGFPIPTITVDGFGDTALTVNDQNSSPGATAYYINSGGTTISSFLGTWKVNYSALASLAVNTASVANVNVQSTAAPTTIDDPSGTVAIGDNGTVQNIRGALTIQGAIGADNVVVDDSADGSAPTVTLRTVTIVDMTGGDALSDQFGQISHIAPALINYCYEDTNAVTVFTGAGTKIKVLATGTTTNLIGTMGTGLLTADTIVTVGYTGFTDSIAGTLNLDNPTGFDLITVNDSADTTGPTVTLATFTPDSPTRP